MIDDNLNGRVKAMLLGRYVRSRERSASCGGDAAACGCDRHSTSVPEIVAPRAAAPSLSAAGCALRRHPCARRSFATSNGTATAGGGWPTICSGKGLRVVATGGPGAAERAYLDGIWDGLNIVRADGGAELAGTRLR